MTTNREKAAVFARYVWQGAMENQEHPGNRLMSALSPSVAAVVREQEFNPRFIDDMTAEDVVDWVDAHIVFNKKGEQVAVSDGCEILWKAA